VHENASRADLTGREVGKVGQLCLALAPQLYQSAGSALSWGLTWNLRVTGDRLLTQYRRLKNPSELERTFLGHFELLSFCLHSFQEGKLPPETVAETLEWVGESLYCQRFSLGNPPIDLKGIGIELMELRELVMGFETDHHLVVTHASWIGAAISVWFHPDQDIMPDTVWSAIRGRALAIMGLLSNIASRSRQECRTFLKDAAQFLFVYDVAVKLAQISDLEDPYEPYGVVEESDQDQESVRDRFVFNAGQVLFDGEDLRLPAGEPVTVLKKLVRAFGGVVPYQEFDPHYSSAAPGTLPKAVVKIRDALCAYGVPCEIKAKRGEGYVIREVQSSEGWE